MNLRIDATDKGAGIGCMASLVRHWYVCHPDGQDLGLIAPRFDTEAEAIAKRDLWNIDVPGHYVMGITEAPPATIFFRRTRSAGRAESPSMRRMLASLISEQTLSTERTNPIMSEYCHDCGTTISDDIETLCPLCKKATGAAVECEMCGTPCDESRMNFVEHEGLDRQICNSCFHNAGF